MKIIKLLLIGSVLAFQAIAQTAGKIDAVKPFKFALFTDIHTGTATSEEDLMRCIEDVNSQDDIDFVIVNGDLTENGLNLEIETAKQRLDKLNKKYYAIAGNHETKWTESGHTRFAQVFGDNKVTFEHNGIRFAGFSSGPVLRMGDAHVSPREIKWLENTLQSMENKKQPVIIFTHVPLIEPADQIDNGHEIADILRQYNTRVILNGHYHHNRALDADRIPAVIFRSTLRGSQPVGGYSIISVNVDSILISERNPVEKTEKKWHSLSMTGEYFSKQAEKHDQGNDSINSSYPGVAVKWQIETGGIITNTAAVDNRRVIAGNELGEVYCLDLETGEILWRYKARNAVYSMPAIDREKVIFGSCDSSIYCLNVGNGRKIWEVKTGHSVMGTPAIEKGKVYIGGSDGTFRAINLKNGKIIWKFDGIKGYIESKPLIYDGKIIFGAWDTNLYALDKNTGTLAWIWNNGLPRLHFSPAACIPVASNGKVFIVAPDRLMTAIDARTGKTVWRTGQHQVRETIGISEDWSRVYARCFVDTVFCISPAADHFEELWFTKTGYAYDINPSMPVEKDGVVFFTTKNGLFVALKAESGQVLWKHKFRNTMIATVTPLNRNELVFTTHDGIIGKIVADDRISESKPQSLTARNHSHLDLSLIWESESGSTTGGDTRLLLGLLLPDGWRVADRGCFTRTGSNDSQADGQFAFCQFYSDYLAKNLETPAGYYWWGGRALDKIPFGSRIPFKVDFSLKVFTGSKTGAFDLKFATGDDPSNMIRPHFVSTPFRVDVTCAGEFPAPKIHHWEPVIGDSAAGYYSDRDFDSYFLRHYGWNGGDVGMSTLLPDGRSVWTWGDYDAGAVNSARTRLNELWQFPRNGIMVQDGLDFSSFRLLTDNNPGQMKPAVIYRDDNGQEVDGGQHWYWPMGGHIFYRNGEPELQILLEHARNAGGGQWGMEAVGVDIAVFSLPALQLQRVVKNRYAGKVGFGNVAFRDDDGIVYIYGERNFEICKSATYVARNTDGDLTGEWEFYDAKTGNWTTEHAWAEINKGNWWKEGHQLIDHALFVFKDGGKYFALEQEPCFSPNTFVHNAASPIGPFTNRRRVGILPSEITTSPYICYIPALHPQFSVNGELLYSVSKNINGDADRFAPGSGNIYLPYFFRVKHWRDKLNIVDNDITSGEGSFSAQYPGTLQYIGDKNENTAYSAMTGNGKAWIQYNARQALFLRRYTLTSSPDSPGSDPLHWQILGSTDSLSWTVLDERYHAAFEERGQTNAYTVPVDRNCRYFRLNVLAANGSSELKIAEWQLFGQR
jgi:outer membrane protein assembly factor BamB/Icc-related predicted phosphoesterase